MKDVAKLVIESNGKYLMMYRSDHPMFGNDTFMHMVADVMAAL